MSRCTHQSKRRAFTIVELLVVIVVIAILATITVVAYNGVAARSRDTAVKSGAQQFADALKLYSANTGKTPLQTGGGWGGNGSGWVSSGVNDPNYPVATETVLMNAGYIPLGFTASLPKNTKYNSNIYTLMLYGCTSTTYVVYYSLEAPSSDDVTTFNNVKSQCSNGAMVQTNYNMQGGVVIQ